MPLIPLSRNPDHPLPSHAIDVRGWHVKTSVDGEKVGKIDDVLLDDRGRLRYLDVDLGLFNKHVLLPLTHAHVDGEQDVVWVDGLTKRQFDAIPEYKHDAQAVTPAYEGRLAEDYRLAASAPAEAEAEALPDVTTAPPRLARLTDLGKYRVASNDADPRGWKVVGGDGERIGEVDELIVDTVELQARYLDCDVEEERLELEPLDRHILIPVEQTRLDAGKKRVVVDGIFARDVRGYPVYGGLPLDQRVERSIEEVFDRAHAASDPDDPSQRFYRKRRRRVEDETPAATRVAAAPPDRGEPGRTVRETVLDSPDQEVRIRVSGSDIIIEKRPAD
jgi:sporulation protein YlmC with PRC-barrel domain